MNNSNIELINNIFKLPIHYVDDKHELQKNIIEDLELNEPIDKESGTPIYNYAFNPKTCFGKKVIKQYATEYTTNTKHLKDTQKLLSELKGIEGEIFRPDFDNIMEIWDEIKNDNGFKEKYQYIDWSYWEYLNKSEVFLQVMSIYNLASPVLSFFVPVIILLVPFFIIQMRGISLTFDEYINVLKKIAANHAIGKLFTHFSSVTLNEKMYMLASAGFYLFSIYQNIMACYRFHLNMQKIHEHLLDLKKYIEYTDNCVQNYLKYSSSCNTYIRFNDKLKEMNTVLMQYKKELDTITPFSYNLTKIMQFGSILKHFYNLYSNDEYNEAFLYSFGFHGYLDTLEGLSENIKTGKMNYTKFEKKVKKDNKNKRQKMKVVGGYYPALIDSNPVYNDIDLTKNNIVTGPNASGKTTILKTSLINVIFSQQMGCGFFKSARFKPFHHIHCYLNIPDTSGRDSLFQAEARRCKGIIDSVRINNKDQHFCVFDELYSGTNPEEAVESAQAFMEYLTKYNGVHSILTTHFMDLCKHLEKNDNFENFHMHTKDMGGGDFTYTYLMKKGISNKKGGFKVLQDMQFPTEIIHKRDSYNKSINDEKDKENIEEIKLESSL